MLYRPLAFNSLKVIPPIVNNWMEAEWQRQVVVPDYIFETVPHWFAFYNPLTSKYLVTQFDPPCLQGYIPFVPIVGMEN